MERAGTDDPIDCVVHRLNAICRDTALGFSLCVGKLIIDSFYGGDVGRWRARGPKTCSFRKLARHPALLLSPGALYRSVAIYELCERLGVNSWKRVSATHLRAVLSLPPEHQQRLLLEAEAQGWPVRRLEQEVASLGPQRDRGGARRRSRLSTMTTKLNRFLQARHELLIPELTELSHPSVVIETIETLERVRLACEAIEHRLRRSLSATEGAPSATSVEHDSGVDATPSMSPRGNN
jgi:hypothetical protein